MTIKDKIYKFMDDSLREDSKVVEAARHIALSKGHLWRPQVTLKIARGYGVNEQNAMPYAVGIEFVHCASLVLDDLPSMDNAPMRRGKQSCHIKYGVDIAELCSHYLIAKCNLLVSGGPAGKRRNARIVHEIAESAQEMIKGQERDLHETYSLANIDKLIEMYKLKSGFLFGTAAVVGGLLGDASEEELNRLRRFGIKVGLAYQLGDDLYDLEQEAFLGKPTHQDERKKTPINLIGKDKTEQLKQRTVNNALEEIRKVNRNFKGLERLVFQITRAYKG